MTLTVTRRAFLALAAMSLAAGARAQNEAPPQLLSYEAIPSVQLSLDLDASTYAQRAEATEAALETLVPAIAAAVSLDGAGLDSEVTPGGYLLKTNASLQTRGSLEDEGAERLAAALGYVFRQWSVLVSQPGDAEEGRTGYVVLGFPEGALTPALAQAFFAFAAQTHQGLGGGYTAFGDEMLFLNLRGEDGAPYSGLADLDFAARLGLAAGSFSGAQAKVVEAGRAEARLVGNDWDAAPGGEDYAAIIGDEDALAALDALRAEHDALILGFADRFGWR